MTDTRVIDLDERLADLEVLGLGDRDLLGSGLGDLGAHKCRNPRTDLFDADRSTLLVEDGGLLGLGDADHFDVSNFLGGFSYGSSEFD